MQVKKTKTAATTTETQQNNDNNNTNNKRPRSQTALTGFRTEKIKQQEGETKSTHPRQTGLQHAVAAVLYVSQY